MIKEKKIGLLVPLFSLPSKYGIGELGNETLEFLRILNEHKLNLWQLLPISPINEENSPYSSLSSWGIDPLYISLDKLIEMGYPITIDPPKFKENRVEYDKVRKYKHRHFYRAFMIFLEKGDSRYDEFIKECDWAYGVGLFLAKYTFFKGKPWNKWNEAKVNHNLAFEHLFKYHLFLQFVANYQFNIVKNTAKECGIELVGDVPFYPGFNSVGVYQNQSFFLLNPDGSPNVVAGVPPDFFSKTGQNWQNPIWNWEKMKENDFALYVDRLGYCAQVFDYVRLDHFRALDTYYVIPGKDKTAIRGEWKRLDGYQILDAFYKKYPKAQLICEDLGGDMNERIPALRDHYHLPGMKEMQYTILNDFHLGDNFIRYTGTHDNIPLKTWLDTLSIEDYKKVIHVLDEAHLEPYLTNDDNTTYTQLNAYLIKCNTNLGIINIVDLLEEGGPENRINAPGTVNKLNWSWRFKCLNCLKNVLKRYKFEQPIKKAKATKK